MDPLKQTTVTSSWANVIGTSASPARSSESVGATAPRADMLDGLVNGVVFIIEPDEALRTELVNTIQGVGLRARAFDRPEAFWAEIDQVPQVSYFCMILEMRYPEISGLEVQRRLLAGPHVAAVVFFASQTRLREVVRGMRAGAIGVTEKAEGVGALLTYVEEGLERARAEYNLQRQCAQTVHAIHSLSAGERSVMQGILSGKLNKEIAQELALSIRTIEQRRREVFRKIGVQHPASLARKVMQVAHNPRMSQADKEYFRALAECLTEWGDEPPRALRLDSPHDRML